MVLLVSNVAYSGVNDPGSGSTDSHLATTSTGLQSNDKITGLDTDLKRNEDGTWSGTLDGTTITKASFVQVEEMLDELNKAFRTEFSIIRDGQNIGSYKDGKFDGVRPQREAGDAAWAQPLEGDMLNEQQQVEYDINAARIADLEERILNLDVSTGEGSQEASSYYGLIRQRLTDQRKLLLNAIDQQKTDGQKQLIKDNLDDIRALEGQALIMQYAFHPYSYTELIATMFAPDMGAQSVEDWLVSRSPGLQKNYADMESWFSTNIPSWMGMDFQNQYCIDRYRPFAPMSARRYEHGNPKGWDQVDLGRTNLFMHAYRRENKDVSGNAMTGFCYENDRFVDCGSCQNCEVTFPNRRDPASWFPNATTDPLEPAGYYYHFEWTVTNPYSQDEIDDGNDRYGQAIADGIKDHEGSINFTIKMWCEACDQSYINSLELDDETFKTSFEYDPARIAPGATLHEVFELYSKNYYDSICITFHDGFRYLAPAKDPNLVSGGAGPQYFDSYPPDCEPENSDEYFAYDVGIIKPYSPDAVATAAAQASAPTTPGGFTP